jgi:ABC-2 type transport system ATP-binding protein
VSASGVPWVAVTRAESIPHTGPVVEAGGLTVRFGPVTALDAVDLVVDDAATGLLGANGAGKSTLMKTLLGLIRPEQGEVRVLGRPVDPRAWNVRRRLGYMPERDCLPREMTASDVVAHMARLRGLDHRSAVLRASEVLFQVGLEEERSRLIGTFSTGMVQRTKLAQALVHSPDLVILDEPTNGLDPSGREEMLALVRRLSSDLGIAVLMSSHVLEDITRTCDAVVVMREGAVAYAGRIDDLAARTGGEGIRVRVSGDARALRDALSATGFAVEATGASTVVVRGADAGAVLDAIRDAAAATGTPLHEVRASGRGLEEALVEALM